MKLSRQGSGEEKFTYEGEIGDRGRAQEQKGLLNLERVLEAVPVGRWVSCAEVAAAVRPLKGKKLSEQTVRAHLKTLVKQGKIQATGEKKLRRYWRPAEGEPPPNETAESEPEADAPDMDEDDGPKKVFCAHCFLEHHKKVRAMIMIEVDGAQQPACHECWKRYAHAREEEKKNSNPENGPLFEEESPEE